LDNKAHIITDISKDTGRKVKKIKKQETRTPTVKIMLMLRQSLFFIACDISKTAEPIFTKSSRKMANWL